MATNNKWDPVADVSSESESEAPIEHDSEFAGNFSDPIEDSSSEFDPGTDPKYSDISDTDSDEDIDTKENSSKQKEKNKFWFEANKQVWIYTLYHIYLQFLFYLYRIGVHLQ